MTPPQKKGRKQNIEPSKRQVVMRKDNKKRRKTNN